MAKPHLYPVISALHKQTQLYTQRRTDSEVPENFRFTVDQLFNFLVVEYGVGSSVTIVPSPVNYVPTSSGNTQNLSQFVIDENGDIWFIDQNGNGLKFTGADKHFIHHQESAADEWEIEHNLNKVPAIIAFDAECQIIGEIDIIDNTTTKLKFTSPVAGFAYCN